MAEIVAFDSGEEKPGCALCGLPFVEDELALWGYGGDGEFALCHQRCPADKERLEMLIEDAKGTES